MTPNDATLFCGHRSGGTPTRHDRLLGVRSRRPHTSLWGVQRPSTGDSAYCPLVFPTIRDEESLFRRTISPVRPRLRRIRKPDPWDEARTNPHGYVINPLTGRSIWVSLHTVPGPPRTAASLARMVASIEIPPDHWRVIRLIEDRGVKPRMASAGWHEGQPTT